MVIGQWAGLAEVGASQDPSNPSENRSLCFSMADRANCRLVVNTLGLPGSHKRF